MTIGEGLVGDVLPSESSDEDKAKDIWLHFEAYLRGDEEGFRAYFQVETPDDVHKHFGEFLPEKPSLLADDLEGFRFADKLLWRQVQRYDDGKFGDGDICGFWYIATPVGKTPSLG